MRLRFARRARFAAVAVALAGTPVAAQQAQQIPAQPAPAAPAPSGEWAKLPRMQLERQFAGPLQDTIVQRWRDPVDGTACYIYLPITVAHSPPAQGGFVQYGANVMGTISCFRGFAPAAAAAGKPTAVPR